MRRGDQAIQCTTTVSVVVLAMIAAILSYKHMYMLVRRYGETSWTAALLPVSVDGMIVASSMSLLLDSRHGRRSGVLAWILLVVGSTASLAANVAVAEPSAVGRLIAGWPSCALIGAYELLMRQVRNASVRHATTHPDTGTTDADTHTKALLRTSRGGPLTNHAASNTPSTQRPNSGSVVNGAQSQSPSSRVSAGRMRDGSIQRRAWQWAVANRTPDGQLPAGKTIAAQFGRSERWGRLVKQVGCTGQYDGRSGVLGLVDR